MTDLFLNLRDRPSVIDFVTECSEYLDPEDPIRREAGEMLEDISAHASIPMEDLADVARRIARATWTARRAIEHYVSTPDGSDEEFRRVTGAVSHSTGHLLERYRHGKAHGSLADILNADESATAFGENERFEIREVRRHLLPLLWHEKRSDLKTALRDADDRLYKIETRIRTLRDLAFATPALEAELTSKIERLEDQLYFAGEELNPDRLDEEISLYKEEQALPSIDE